MSRIYIRKTIWEQYQVKESGVTVQGRRELEIGTLLLDNDKNNVIAYKVLSYL